MDLMYRNSIRNASPFSSMHNTVIHLVYPLQEGTTCHRDFLGANLYFNWKFIANCVSKDLAVVDMRFAVTAAALTIPEIGLISFIASTTLGITASASDALQDQRE